MACERFTDLVKRNECCFTRFEPATTASGEACYGVQLFIKIVEHETALEPAKVGYEDVAENLIEEVELIE